MAGQYQTESRTSGYRQKRRALDKARRRRRNARALAALAGLFIVAAVVYVLVSGSGSEDTQDIATPEAGNSDGLVFVRVVDRGTMPVALLLGSDADPSFVLGMPADTLLEGPEGFGALDELHASYEVGEINFATLVGSSPTASVTVNWRNLLDQLPARGSEGAQEPWPETLENTPEGAETAAQAFAGLVASVGGDGGSDPEELVTEGGGQAFADTVRALAPAPAVAGRIPGEVVEGLGYTYYEPNLTALRQLLGGDAEISQTEVEVQNGSGAAGIAEQVTDALEPLGYTMLPPKNAEQFPNVENTRILAAPDVLTDAERIREVLGRGRVVQREDLPSGRVVVVTGKDLPPEALSPAAP